MASRILLALILLAAIRADAVTTNAAANCNLLSVSNAVALCSAGDYVSIPAGNSGTTWSNTLEIAKRISIIGAGSGSTFLTSWVANPSPYVSNGMIRITPDSDGYFELKGFSICGSTNNNIGAVGGAAGELIIDGRDGGTNSQIRISDVKVENVHRVGIVPRNVIGVIDSCIFHQTNNHSVEPWHQSWGGYIGGNGAWADDPKWGSAQFLFIEDCVFTNNGYAAMDAFAGARYVFRHNILTNSSVEVHGTESSQFYRGARSVEAYFNNLYGDNHTYFYARGAPWLVFSNVCTANSAQGFFFLVDYRDNAPFVPWGGTDGTNAWDNIRSTGAEVTGTHNGANGAVTLDDSTKTWTVNQWYPGFVVQNTSTTKYSMIQSNTATRLYLTIDGFGWNTITFDAGQTYKIFYVTNALDGCGMGKGDLLQLGAGDQPTNTTLGGIAWPRQTVEGTYQWGNTYDSTNAIVSAPTGYPLIRKNWHYFDQMEKSAYAPYQYPHPYRLPPPINQTLASRRLSSGRSLRK